jgi:CheY-like chemotaxis protein/anti-sigma regulatory factor (Ser/Thr protein kinase)
VAQRRDEHDRGPVRGLVDLAGGCHLLVVGSGTADDRWPGASATVVETVDAAQEALSEEKVDCVVVDLTAVGAEGLAMVADLATISPTVPVIAASDSVERTGLPLAALAHGAQDHVTVEMLSPKVLRETVDRAKRRKAAMRQPAGRHAATFPPAPGSPREVRRWMRPVLDEWVPEHLDAVLLVTSEIVTNAVVHAHTPVEVTLRPVAGGVRVGVEDRRTEEPVRRTAGSDAESGRGLGIVEAMSSRWGVVQRPGGKLVWFELTGSGSEGPSP